MKTLTLLLSISAIILYGCKGKEETQTNAHPIHTVLRCGVPQDLVTIDPGKCMDTPTSVILSQCYEGLMRINEIGNIETLLAEKVETSKDGKTYTFSIKKGVKFHNGEELTAQDFKWTFERNLSKKFNSPHAPNFLNDIVGAKAYQQGKASEITGVKVLNPYTLQIQIETPRGYFLYKLAYIVTHALSSKTTPLQEATQIGQAAGTGPFKLSEYTKNALTKLDAHKDYHGDKPHIDSLEYSIIPDPSMMLNKIKKNQLDFAELNFTNITHMENEPSLKNNLKCFSENVINYLEFNPSKAPLFKNPKVRLAIAHAINREELAKEALEGKDIPAYYMIPKGILGYRTGKGDISFDVKKAKQLLQEANINPANLHFNITVSNKGINKKIAENLSVQLKKNLGAKIEIDELPWDTYLAKSNHREIPVRFGGWGMDYPDPSNILTSLFSSFSKLNDSGYSNIIFDNFTKKADASLDTKEREILYQQAEDTLLKDALVIPLFNPNRYYWVGTNIKGIRLSPNGCGVLPHNRVDIK